MSPITSIPGYATEVPTLTHKHKKQNISNPIFFSSTVHFLRFWNRLQGRYQISLSYIGLVIHTTVEEPLAIHYTCIHVANCKETKIFKTAIFTGIRYNNKPNCKESERIGKPGVVATGSGGGVGSGTLGTEPKTARSLLEMYLPGIGASVGGYGAGFGRSWSKGSVWERW